MDFKLYFYSNEERDVSRTFSGIFFPRLSKYYLIFTRSSFLWLLLPLVFIFSLLLKVFFNNTVWSRFLLWIRKYIWLNKLNLVLWFSIILEIVCDFWNTKQNTSINCFSFTAFSASRMICYLLKWKTQHCTGQTTSPKIFVSILFYYGARESRETEIKTLMLRWEMKTVEISFTSLPSFQKIFLGAAEMLCVLISCDYLLE